MNKNRLTCVNAPAPLRIEDDYGEQVHPDVLYVPGGFCGWEYWMAYTPYPRGDDRVENPMIRVSQDGLQWERHPTIPEPVVPPPVDKNRHHADPELVYHKGVLYIVYMTTERCTGETWFSVLSTGDVKTWNEPKQFLHNFWGCCPTLVVEQDIWQMWFVELNTHVRGATAGIYYCVGQNLFNLAERRTCALEIPNHTPWHIDVQRTDAGYEALVAAFPKGMDNSRTRLFHMVSEDGISFRPMANIRLLRPSILGWDNRAIYRSCFLKDTKGSYRIWYSASSWGLRWGIGYLEENQGFLRGSAHVSLRRHSVLLTGWEDMMGRVRYGTRRYLPKNLRVLVSRIFKLQSHADGV